MSLKWWTTAYVVILVSAVVTMFLVRKQILTKLATPEAISQWQAWREDVRRQQTEYHPVERRVPKSEEPPALLLMRDHFVVSLFGAVLFITALYWVLAWFIAGALNKSDATRSL
jgi:hypothetical protein